MKLVEPEVFLIGYPQLDYDAISRYLRKVGGEQWLQRIDWSASMRGENRNDAQNLVEFEGRLCYKSWEPGLNPNVTKIREDQGEYLGNILSSYHGSVLEHATFNFAIHSGSRVFTHEMVRHGIGTAISQESMRFVRFDEIPFWLPDWSQADTELQLRVVEALQRIEEFQQWMADYFDLNNKNVPFSEKKHKTSFMRRFLPEGVATELGWSANIRSLRHVIETRTAPGAEEEIRIIAGKIGEIMKERVPALFGDYTVEDGVWTPSWRKV